MKVKKWQIALIILGTIIISIVVLIKNKSIPVLEIPLEKREVKRTVSASGVVTSKNRANLSFATLGRVLNVSVKEGDDVSNSHYLAMVENFAESQTAQGLKDSRDITLRDRELYIENYSTNPDAVGGRDEYEIGLRRQNELVSKAESAYRAQQSVLGRGYLYAPFDGKVIDILKEVGETALAGETIIKIADVNHLVFEITLDQEDFGLLQKNQEVEITLDAYEKEIFKGFVNKLPNYVDSSNGQKFIIKIEFFGDNTDKILLGMTGDAYIVLQKTESEVLSLPFDEINYDNDDKPFLYLLSNNIIEKLYIETGVQGDIFTEILTKIELPIVKSASEKITVEEGMRAKISK